MIKKITLAFLALFVLAGCSSSSSSKKGSMVTGAESSLLNDFEKNVGDRVWFSYDSSDLSTETKAQLTKMVAWFKDHSNVKFTIEGHCDERGSREYNLALGERRADKVKHFFLHHGILDNKMDVISYGKERPAVIGDNEAAWKQNRRSVIVISVR